MLRVLNSVNVMRGISGLNSNILSIATRILTLLEKVCKYSLKPDVLLSLVSRLFAAARLLSSLPLPCPWGASVFIVCQCHYGVIMPLYIQIMVIHFAQMAFVIAFNGHIFFMWPWKMIEVATLEFWRILSKHNFLLYSPVQSMQYWYNQCELPTDGKWSCYCVIRPSEIECYVQSRPAL